VIAWEGAIDRWRDYASAPRGAATDDVELPGQVTRRQLRLREMEVNGW
jgi:hypothetical protein